MFSLIFCNFSQVAVIKSAASATSPEGLQAEKLDFQAVIKLAASAVSPTAWGAPRRRSGKQKAASGRSPSRRGGCASSRLDHGLKVQLFPKHAQNMRKTGAKHAQNMRKTCAKHTQNIGKSLKSRFEPKGNSSKMGLSITPRQFL